MSDDLPEPETPVTQVNRPTGKRTVISLRLLCLAPTRVSQRPLVRRRPPPDPLPAATVRSPRRDLAVSESTLRLIMAGGPGGAGPPPPNPGPAPGPKSTT